MHDTVIQLIALSLWKLPIGGNPAWAKDMGTHTPNQMALLKPPPLQTQPTIHHIGSIQVSKPSQSPLPRARRSFIGLGLHIHQSFFEFDH